MLLTLQSCVEELPLEKQGGDDFHRAAASPENGPESSPQTDASGLQINSRGTSKLHEH